MGIITIVLLTVAFTSAAAKGGCAAPKANPMENCPDYGFNCRSADIGKFDLSTANGKSVLTCKDRNALLFVGGTSTSQLECTDKKWHFGENGVHDADSAICAKSCTTCMFDLPDFANDSAVQAFFSGGNSPDAKCAVAFCDAPGLRLIGIHAANKTKVDVLTGKLACAGEGWVDGQGHTFDYAACAYYSCPAPVAFAGKAKEIAAFGKPVEPKVRHGAASCPKGYKMAVNDNGNTHFTLNPLVCGPTGEWTLLGGVIANTAQVSCVLECVECNQKPSKVNSLCKDGEKNCQDIDFSITITGAGTKSATCQTSVSCEDIDFAPVVSDGANTITSATACVDKTITTTKGVAPAAACKKFKCNKDAIASLNSTVCADSKTTACGRVHVHSSRVTCDSGYALVYTTTTEKTPVETDYLTCAADGGSAYWDAKNNNRVEVKAASCRKYKQKCRRCSTLRNIYEISLGVSEYPAGAALGQFESAVDKDGCSILTCKTGQMFANDSPNLPIDGVTCEDDHLWYSTEAKLPVVSAGCFEITNCPIPKAPAGGSPAALSKGRLQCPNNKKMQFRLSPEAKAVNVDTFLTCGTYGRLVYNQTSFLPNNVLVGCY